MKAARRALGVPGTQAHSSAGFSGAQSLSAASAQFNAPFGSNGFTTFWFKLDTITPGAYVKLFEVGAGAANTAATEVMGIQLDGPSGFLGAFNTDGSVYGSVLSNFAPTAGVWYLVEMTWGGTLTLTVYDHTGAVINSWSNAAATPYNALAAPTLWLGSGAALAFPMTGELDSVGHWRSGGVGATPGFGAYLANSGKAIDFIDLNTGAFSGTVASLSAWYNLDQPSGATNWIDGGPNGVTLVSTGTVLQKRGSGY